jgi:hypothetical protein
MGDTPYALLQSAPLEIIYVDPALPIQLLPQPSGSAAAAAAPVLGAVGAVVGSLIDSNQAQKTQDAAQKQLDPYQDEIKQLDIKDMLLPRVEGIFGGIPTLANAKITHIPAAGLTTTLHDLALKSEAQEVLIVVPQLYFWPDAKALGVSTRIVVFIKPHPSQAVQYESNYFGGNSKLPLPANAKPSIDDCLKQWFADDGAQLKTGFNDAADRLDKGLQIYFRQQPPTK